MIKGKQKKELTIESILERTSSHEIFTHFFGPFEINRITCNHLRGDRSPSFLIGNKYGELSMYDYADSDWRGDCFNLVKQIYKCSLNEALKIIDKELSLGILEGVEVRSKPISQLNEPISKKNTLIQVTSRKFLKSELDWWSQYGITLEELQKENIYSIKKAYLNKKLLSLDELRFAYYYEGLFKIYQPNSDKKRKWLSNVPLTYLDGKENIKDCEVAWITKSKKDKIILMKLFSCVVATQNESLACFSQENVDFIKGNSKKQVVIFDNDNSGKKASLEITKKLNMLHCNVPDKYLSEGITDFADLTAKYGLKYVENHLKSKNLI